MAVTGENRYNRMFEMLCNSLQKVLLFPIVRGGSRAAATSKMERFVIIANGFQPLTIYHKVLHLGCCSSPRSASDCGFPEIYVSERVNHFHNNFPDL